MAQVHNWTRISNYLTPVGGGQPLKGVSVMIEELAQLVGDAAFVERADMAASQRISVLEDMLAACEQELDGQEGEAARELDSAIAELREELACHRNLALLDAAFREDQRDAIRARLERFREGVQNAIHREAPFEIAGAILMREDLDALLRIMMTCDADQIFRIARMQAAGPDSEWLADGSGQRLVAGHATGAPCHKV